jgi:quercetin dioxygenase-like cupin family protein
MSTLAATKEGSPLPDVEDDKTMANDKVAAADPKRFVISRRDDAPKLGDYDITTTLVGDDADLAWFDQVVDAGYNNGLDARLLYRQQGDHPISVVHLRAKPGRPFLRHSHSTNCAYVVTSGEVRLGRQVLRSGDLFYVPAGHPYQYVAGEEGADIVEFRTDHARETYLAPNSDENWAALVRRCTARRLDWIAQGDR